MIKNLNELAEYIAKEESGAEQVSIAQIKEILKIQCLIMARQPHIADMMQDRGFDIIGGEDE